MTRRWPIPRLASARRRADDGAGAAQQEAFRRLVLPHLDAAWNYARYLARDADLAEDIVQDAFLKAFRAQSTCRGDGKAWLMTIVRHCWHDWLRVHQPHMISAVEMQEPVEADTPHSLLERADDAVHVRKMLEALPEPFREALILRELEEMPYRDIAAVTGAPVGTVMSRLARAREMLAKLVLIDDATDETGARTA